LATASDRSIDKKNSGAYIRPLARPIALYAILAQLVEQLTRNEQVIGSIPMDGSVKKALPHQGVPFLRLNHWHTEQWDKCGCLKSFYIISLVGCSKA
jgi:hypothetical protein